MTIEPKTVTRKIGLNRGKPRLWLERKVLTEAGFAPGDKFSLTETKPGVLLISRAPLTGKRTVSGKGDRPVIDIAGTVLTQAGLAHGDTVTVDYHNGSAALVVTKQEA